VLLAIDPGNVTGFALFEGKDLVTCGVLTKDQAKSRVFDNVDTLVIERPKIYPGARQEVPPDDLITLAILVGEIKALYRLSGVETEEVLPYAWKGQLPKDISHKRIKKCLNMKENSLVESVRVSKSNKHNMLDAVGIGLWRLGRRYMGSGRSA